MSPLRPPVFEKMADFDIKEFESQAMVALDDITTFPRASMKRHAKRKAAKKKSAKKHGARKRSQKATTASRLLGVSQERKRFFYIKAQSWLKDNRLLKIVCPGLKGISQNMTEVLKQLIVLLIPLSLAKAVVVPLDPYAYAMLAFVISKFGVDILCGQQNQ